MKELTKRKGLMTIFIGLGDCPSLLNPTGCFGPLNLETYECLLSTRFWG
jgi:hypothetical protein